MLPILLLMLTPLLFAGSKCDPENAFQQCFPVSASGISMFELKSDHIAGVYRNGRKIRPSGFKLITQESAPDSRPDMHPMYAVLRSFRLVIPTQRGDVVEIRYVGYEGFKRLLDKRDQEIRSAR